MFMCVGVVYHYVYEEPTLIVVSFFLSARVAMVAPVVSTSVRNSEESAANQATPTTTTGEAVKAATIGSETAKASTKTKETKATGHQDIQLSDDSESEVPIHT